MCKFLSFNDTVSDICTLKLKKFIFKIQIVKILKFERYRLWSVYSSS